MASEKRRLIDANALRETIESKIYWGDIGLLEAIDDAPTVEVVHGRWERCGGDLHSSGYAIYCSVCYKTHFVHYKHSLGGLSCEELFEKPKYCPSCGAVMEIEE